MKKLANGVLTVMRIAGSTVMPKEPAGSGSVLRVRILIIAAAGIAERRIFF